MDISSLIMKFLEEYILDTSISLVFLMISLFIHETGHFICAWKRSVPIVGIQIFTRGPYISSGKFKIPLVFHYLPGECAVYCGDMTKSSPIEYNTFKLIAAAGPGINILVGVVAIVIFYIFTDTYIFTFRGWLMFGVINIGVGILNLAILKKGSDGWCIFRSTRPEADEIILDGYSKFIKEYTHKSS